MSREFRVLITDRAWPDCAIERDILGRDRGGSHRSPQRGRGDARCAGPRRGCHRHLLGSRHRKRDPRFAAMPPRCPLRDRPRQYQRRDGNRTRHSGQQCSRLLRLGSVGPRVGPDPGLCRNIAFFHARTKAGEYRLAAAPAHEAVGRMRRLAWSASAASRGPFCPRRGPSASRSSRTASMRTIAGPAVRWLPLDELLRPERFCLAACAFDRRDARPLRRSAVSA